MEKEPQSEGDKFTPCLNTLSLTSRDYWNNDGADKRSKQQYQNMHCIRYVNDTVVSVDLEKGIVINI